MGAEEDLLSLAKAFLAAWNAHDLDAVMTFCTDDVVLKVGPPPAPPGSEVATGKRQLRSVALGSMPGFRAEAWHYQVSGNRVSWMGRWSCELFQNMGVDEIEATTEAVFERDKIKSYTVTFSPETIEKFGADLIQPP